MTILKLTREAVLARAYRHLGLLHRGIDEVERPIAYRLDDSGLLGGDNPLAPHCADLSFGGRTLTADCIGFALYCAGIGRHQPGYKGSRGAWLNTDSVLDDAHGQQAFFTPVDLDEAIPGDLVVTRSKYLFGKRIKYGHIEVLLRRRYPGGKMLSIGCSPRFGRATAIGVGEQWSAACEVVRPRNYI